MRENMSDQYFGITLVDDDDTSVPGWKVKLFLKNINVMKKAHQKQVI